MAASEDWILLPAFYLLQVDKFLFFMEFSDRGILVVDGTDLYSFLSRWPDGWHARSTDKNKQLMVEYYANLIRTMILEL